MLYAETIRAAFMMRRAEVEKQQGLRKSLLYKQIQNGEFVPPIKISERAAAWISTESDAIKAARIAGKSSAEIKELVQQLVASRTNQSV
jgi:prophage regulatory protein